MNSNSDRLIELIGQAMEKKLPAERERFLAEVCQGEPELRAQLEALLRSHEEAGPFLKNIAAAATPDIALEKPGDRIGRYKLLQKIGEGGCGVVYMAEQEEPVRRKVALKVIKLGMDTKSVVARFEAERQALAMMDHPNIAKVFDGGATETPVAAGILPAVEPGFKPGGQSVSSLSGRELSDAAPGGRMPPSTAGRMLATTFSAGRP